MTLQISEQQGAQHRIMLLGSILIVHVAGALLCRHGLIRDDAESYVSLARNLNAGWGYVFEEGGHPTSWRAPGYPFFLAAIFRLAAMVNLSEYELLVARLANAVLWLVTSIGVYRLASRTVGERSASFAAAATGLYPCFVGFTGLLWSESLFTCLFTGTVLALISLGERRSASYWVAVGLLFGATVLTRSTAIVLIPALAILAWMRRSQRPLASAAIVTVVALTVVGAWSLRNYSVHGRFILVESNAGFNLYIGNRAGTPVPFAWKSMDTLDQGSEYQRLTASKPEGERHEALMAAAKQYMCAHPWKTLARAATKTFDFWLPDFFVARNVQSGALGPYQSYWLGMLFLTVSAFLTVTSAAACHAYRYRRTWYVQFLAAVALLYTLPHLIVFGASRHHVPLMPLLIVIAAPELQRIAVAFQTSARKVTVRSV